MASRFLFLAFILVKSNAPVQCATETYPIVDTGVTDFYSENALISKPSQGQSFYGQDAHYSGKQPSYKDNGDGTITDLVTGLMWQQTMPLKMSVSAASNFAKNLRLGGYSDWRMSTIKELYSLILFTGDVSGETAGSKLFIDTKYFLQPLGNTSLGEREIDAQTMSANKYTGKVFGNQDCWFGVNFIDGRIKCYDGRKPFFFRFVRGSTTYGVNSFSNNGDGTITDKATGLMWQQDDSGQQGMEWKKALAYCEDLTYAGHSDWRLPNVKELQSIVDYTRGPQTTTTAAIDTTFFKASPFKLPDGSSDFAFYWSGTTHKDGVQPATKGAYVAFGQGWGKPSSLMDVHGAGCQRSDPKSAAGGTYPSYMGPQKDMRVVYNYARCVRSA